MLLILSQTDWQWLLPLLHETGEAKKLENGNVLRIWKVRRVRSGCSKRDTTHFRRERWRLSWTAPRAPWVPLGPHGAPWGPMAPKGLRLSTTVSLDSVRSVPDDAGKEGLCTSIQTAAIGN